MPKEAFDSAAVKAQIQQQISDVLSKKKIKVKPGDIVEGVSLTTQLGIDSLDVLQLVANLEKQHKIKIPEEELKKMDDIGGIMKSLAKHWQG